ncbi:MAG: hypothetical protein II978_05220 [Clostridia bacterium]|nr:hypothetical protein [Clostridia bacterium]
MERINLNPIIEKVVKVVESHKLGTGKYSRWIWQNEEGNRDLGVTAFGCADATNILYTINRFPKDPAERAEWIAALQSIQDEKTGMFYEDTHIPTHVTAHCTAALELFDALPLYPFYDIEKYKDPKAMCELLESLDWVDKRGPGHIMPANYSSFRNTRAVSPEWVRTYFDWLNKACDPEKGLWREGYFTSDLPMHQHMADSFHFLFTYEHAKEPFPYPDKLIDSCLEMYNNNKMSHDFGKRFHFTEVDWVFCLNRASRQTPHRFYEVKEALFKFAKDYTDYLLELDWDKDDGANDMHMLFGTLCCLAELQIALHGKLYSDVPLRQVLDRRPFI